ncbi:hypothetical protein N801_06445 [Knoellia aerolata DSM 18566]|uniref:Uncharacterized protein n=1 Tax=Knoellia aerolata DSM 18566 TaxID=1385519 RepID=A0A0A0K022_9MICO|nr:hypothetical protein N801_06445 [Knoellia aerolata DSM 18566]
MGYQGAPMEESCEVGNDRLEDRRLRHVGVRDPVDVRRPNRSLRIETADPLVFELSVAVEQDDADLDDAITSRRQPRGLNVNHGVAGPWP